MERRVQFKIAVISDTHVGRPKQEGIFDNTFTQMLSEKPDAIVVAGDITDHGTPEEAREAARIFRRSQVPIFAVIGNHDHWAGKLQEVKSVLQAEAHVHFLDGKGTMGILEKDGAEVAVVGAEGFGTTAKFWDRKGQDMQTESGLSVLDDEVQKFEGAVGELATRRPNTGLAIGVLHYAPVARPGGTLQGEMDDIALFLGDDRFGKAVDNNNNTGDTRVIVVFHGHADLGSEDGQTDGGTPVHNVSMQAALKQGRRLYRIFDIDVVMQK